MNMRQIALLVLLMMLVLAILTRKLLLCAKMPLK